MIIGIIVGFVLGALAGVTTTALIIVGKRSDELLMEANNDRHYDTGRG